MFSILLELSGQAHYLVSGVCRFQQVVGFAFIEAPLHAIFHFIVLSWHALRVDTDWGRLRRALPLL